MPTMISKGKAQVLKEAFKEKAPPTLLSAGPQGPRRAAGDASCRRPPCRVSRPVGADKSARGGGATQHFNG